MDFTPENGTITMFSTTWCGYCNRLKKQLDAQGIGYTEINIEEVEGTAELVEQLKREGYPVNESDLTHIWPTRYAHLNVYGRYHFNIEEARERKGLRPLRPSSSAIS